MAFRKRKTKCVCEMCGKQYDPLSEVEEDDFDRFLLSYDNVSDRLCGKCADEVIENMIEGYYFETCEVCGKKFDYVIAKAEYETAYPDLFFEDSWEGRIRCLDCAIEFYEKESEEQFRWMEEHGLLD